MGAGKSRPLDTDPRCETLAPIWGPFVDAFVENSFLCRQEILDRCREQHLDSHNWDHVESLYDALRKVAFPELRGGSASTLALLRERAC